MSGSRSGLVAAAQQGRHIIDRRMIGARAKQDIAELEAIGAAEGALRGAAVRLQGVSIRRRLMERALAVDIDHLAQMGVAPGRRQAGNAVDAIDIAPDDARLAELADEGT